MPEAQTLTTGSTHIIKRLSRDQRLANFQYYEILLNIFVVVLIVSMDQMAIIGAVQSLAGLKRVLSAFESPEKKILVLATM